MPDNTVPSSISNEAGFHYDAAKGVLAYLDEGGAECSAAATGAEAVGDAYQALSLKALLLRRQLSPAVEESAMLQVRATLDRVSVLASVAAMSALDLATGLNLAGTALDVLMQSVQARSSFRNRAPRGGEAGGHVTVTTG